MTRLYANNAATTLAVAISSTGATSCTLTSATNFPTISGSDYYMMTIDDGTNIEIVKVTAATGTAITTMVRAQEGTTAATFAIGANAEIRETAQAFSDVGINVTDNTTNDVSITAHGFAPKAPNDATKYLDGTGAWTVPAGGGGGSGDVVGPASALGNGIALFDGTTGKLLKNMASSPGADRLIFWDNSATSTAYLTLGTNLSITGTTLDASGGGTPGGSTTQVQYNNAGAFAGDAGFTYNSTGDYTITNNLTVDGVNLQNNTVSAVGTNVDLTLSGSSSTQLIIASGTAAIQIPKGSTAQRPAASQGNLRLNTSTFNVEIAAGGSWYPMLSDINFGSAGIMQCTGAGAYSVLATTGSGNVVRATSPTLVTPALGTPSSINLSNATNANTPAFSARNSGTQTVTTGVITKIQLNSEDFDTGSYFDNATNYRFTPLIAGKYLFTFYFVGTITTSAVGAIAGYIYKNGAVIAKNFASYSTGAELYTTVTCVVDMNGSTDYIEGYGLLTPGTVVSAGCVLSGFRLNI